MGCDIHMVLERKVDGKWLGLHDFPYGSGKWRARDRNYRRFNEIAGVRGEGPATPKGLPADISDLGRYVVAYWDGDGHSHTWLTLREAIPIFLATEYWGEGEKRRDDEHAKKWPASYFFDIEDGEEDMDEYRLIIFFDN